MMCLRQTVHFCELQSLFNTDIHKYQSLLKPPPKLIAKLLYDVWQKAEMFWCFWLKSSIISSLFFFQIGVWKSWGSEGLDIKDIVWPANSHTPPQGVPDKFHLKITFLEEPPYISLAPPDPVTGKCTMDRGILCRVASDTDLTE